MAERTLILYDDGDWSQGHYRGIFGLYLRALLAAGLRVAALCPQPAALRDDLAGLPEETLRRGQIQGVAATGLKTKYRRLKPLTRIAWRARAAAAVHTARQRLGTDAPVFFMNINHLRGPLWTDRPGGRLLPAPRAAFSYDSSVIRRNPDNPAALQKQFHFLAEPGCRAFGVTDEKMTAPMQAALPHLRVVFLPDATCTDTAPSPLVQPLQKRADGRPVIGLLGMLHKRKGLLEAVQAATTRPDLFFLFAGACDLNKMTPAEADTVQAFLDHPPENCLCHTERIEDEAQLNDLVQHVDLVWALYPGFPNSSGLLTKAGWFGKPCLVAAGNTCMADRVQTYRLGLSASAENPRAVSTAIDRLLSPERPRPQTDTFRDAFSQQALQSALLELVSALHAG